MIRKQNGSFAQFYGKDGKPKMAHHGDATFRGGRHFCGSADYTRPIDETAMNTVKGKSARQEIPSYAIQ